MARGSRWPCGGGVEDRETPVPESRCTACKRGARVLPVEIAPRKSYTRAVIETACATYVCESRAAISPRQTVAQVGKNAPHPSSVHGWLGGIGARVLGRLDRHYQGPPVAALIAESSKGLDRQLQTEWSRPYPVAAHKYRSLQRREQLEACAKLFDLAPQLFPQAAYPFLVWEQWLETRFHVLALGFPARFCCVPIQHHAPRKVVVPSAPSRPQKSDSTKGKDHGARGPP